MPGIPLLDELMANAWPPAEVEIHGGWRFRWTNGVTRRASSALALGNGEHVETLVAKAETFYRSHDAPTLVQVSTASAPPTLVPYLEDRGYLSTALTLVAQAMTSAVAGRARPASHDLDITAATTDEWFDTYWSVEAGRGRSETDEAICRDVLLAPGLPTVFAAARQGSAVVGVGQLVVERGWGGIQCMATVPDHRRRGVAGTVLSGLAEEAQRLGVERLYLAVMANNDAARALYEHAGFEPVHEYRYFTRVA